MKNKSHLNGRRQILQGAVALGLASVTSTLRAQEAWPRAKPIKIIVPFPPGNTIDIVTRLIQPKLGDLLGQSVYIENIAGAYGRIGMSAIARAKPDGYTVGAVQGGPMIVQPHTVKDLPYDTISDFIPVAVSAWNYNALAGSNSAPFKTLSQMVVWARENPGRLTVGTTGEGGFSHLWFEDFCRKANFTYIHVPYKGVTQIATDLMSGQIMAGADGISGFSELVKADRIRLLAITNKTRVEAWPDVPALSEITPDFAVNGWFGFAVPAKTPMSIVEKLNLAINSVIQMPSSVERLSTYGLMGVAHSASYFDTLNKTDHARYGAIVKMIGIKPQ